MTEQQYLEQNEKLQAAHSEFRKSQAQLRSLVNSIYTMQKARIQTGNQIFANFRWKLGVSLSPEQEALLATIHGDGEIEAEDTDSKDVKRVKKEISEILKNQRAELEAEYKALVLSGCKGKDEDAVDRMRSFSTIYKDVKPKLITTEIEFLLFDKYQKDIKYEQKLIRTLSKYLEQFPIYTEFLSHIRGCGPLMSAVVIAYLDPHKARHRSSFYTYCGLDQVAVADPLAPNGVRYEGRGKKKHHLVHKEAVARDGSITEFEGISYQAFLHTKLLGVLGGSFIKTNSPYRKIYDDAKVRFNQSKAEFAVRVAAGDKSDYAKIEANLSPAHIHARCNREMVKVFVSDLWCAWRELENLPISAPYRVQVLNQRPHKDGDFYERFLKLSDLKGLPEEL